MSNIKKRTARKKITRITGLTVGGFKSIGDEKYIEIGPLTVLCGANSAGKSSFMQPLLLLKQTLEAPSDPGALLLDGHNVRFTSAEQLLYRMPGRTLDRFMVRLFITGDQSIELGFVRKAGEGFKVHRSKYTSPEQEVLMTPEMTHKQIIKVLRPPFSEIPKQILKTQNVSLRWSVRQSRCFLTFSLEEDSRGRSAQSIPFLDFSPRGTWLSRLSPGDLFVPFIAGIIHLPGFRGKPLRTYPKTASGSAYPGTFEDYVASVIAGWQETKPQKLKELGDALRTMGLTWKVKAEPVGDTQVELKVARLTRSRRGGAHDLVSIADVGFGVSQSLPVVVALLAARSGQLVYLEQPEIHLHPLAQRRLALILRDAVERGVVTVVETHSAILLKEIQTLIAKGVLAKEDVTLHWFQRDDSGDTIVTTAYPDDQGAYGDWPEDFEQTELQAENDYLDAVERRGNRE